MANPRRSWRRVTPSLVLVLVLILSSCATATPEVTASAQSGATGGSSDDRPAVDDGAEAESAPAAAEVDTSRFTEVNGSTGAGDYALQMPNGVTTRVEKNSVWDITDYYHVYEDGDQLAMLLVSDRTEHFGDDDVDAQKEGVEFMLSWELELERGLSVTRDGAGEPITLTPVGSDREVIGHSADFTVGSRSGSVQFVTRDLVWYGIVGIGLNDSEWDYMASSLSTHYIAAPTEEEVAEIAEADAEAATELAESQAALATFTDGVPFSEGPFEPRELDPATGGWGYLGGAPFGGVEPGTDASLDEYWIDCREGDGYACDSLYIESEFGSVYERFGHTCGGRTANMGCDELLGSELHPEFFGPYLADVDFYINRVDGYRLDRIPGPDSLPPGEDELLDGFWVLCGLGADPSGCQKLRRDRDIIPDVYQAYGLSCGGRRPYVTQPCRILMSDPSDRIAAGTPPPGTIGDEADELWLACDRDERSCIDLATYPWDIPIEERGDAWSENWEAYREFAASCGGRYDQALSADNCRGAGYLEWPVVDNVEELPVQPLPG